MLKKITVVLLGVCVTSMTLTGVSAADFSDGMTEAAVEEDTFTDGSEGIKTESITAMVNDMAAHAQEKGQEYQKLKVQKNIAAERRASAERAKKIAAMVEESNRKVEQKRVAERKSLVNFALQFEGNPYVYGGTSLTNGADCSGFVMSVFKEFGYDLPRVAAAQYEASQKRILVSWKQEIWYSMEQAGSITLPSILETVRLFMPAQRQQESRYPIITMRHRLESEPMLNKTIKDKAPERKFRGLFFC